MRTHEDRWDWLYLSVAIVLALVAVGMTLPTFAGDEKKYVPKPPTTGESLAQTNTATQVQTVTAGGGQGGGASSQLSMGGDHTTAIGLSTTSPIPLEVPGAVLPTCWLPTKARSYFYGAFAASSNYKRDRDCVADLEAARAHELEVLKLRTAEAEALAQRENATTKLECELAVCATE